MMRPDEKALRLAYSCFPSGVSALCCLREGQPIGMVASTLVPMSLNPALLSVCIQKASNTWKQMKGLPRVGVSFLGAQQGELCRQLAGPAEKRFSQVDWEASPTGAVFVRDATAWFECSIYASTNAGDHELAMLWIENFQANPDVAPLVFHASKFKTLLGEPSAIRTIPDP